MFPPAVFTSVCCTHGKTTAFHLPHPHPLAPPRMIVPHLARKHLVFSVGINRERNGNLAFVFLCLLENKAAFVLVGSIIHGAMRRGYAPMLIKISICLSIPSRLYASASG